MRTDEWTLDFHGMISTVVIDIFDDGMVHIRDEIMTELGLTPDLWPEVTLPSQEKFARAVPYSTVSTQLWKMGWVPRVDPT